MREESISYNGRIVKTDDANLPAPSAAALYGRGAFTTLAIYGGKPFLLAEHLQRLRKHAGKINLDLSEFSGIEKSLRELLEANQIANGRARITLFDASGSRIWNFRDEQKTTILIIVAERNETKNDLTLTVSPFRINSASPLIGIKSCNYLENLIAFETANSSDFDEAIRLNERGEIVSACLANLFWVKNEQIFTPPLETGALAGTTRHLIFELAKQSNLPISEVSAGIDRLETADEIFLTSAGIEICSARQFAGNFYQNSVAKLLQTAFAQLINE